MTTPDDTTPVPSSLSVSESGPVAVGGDVSITGAVAAGRDVVIERLSVIADDWAPSGDAATRPGASTDVCPYPGIQPFADDQRPWFAGRDRDRSVLAAHLERSSFVAVIGGSGSGKSSLLAAGVGPDFVEARQAFGEVWTIRSLRPGADPAKLLAGMLGQPAEPRTLWLIDQLEEAFASGVTAASRTTFFDGICAIADGVHGTAKVIVALRSDFYPSLDAHRGLADAVAAHQHRLLPLDRDSLREVILRPAESVGLRVEPALVEQVLSDIDPGANQLPLLAYAMRETWRRRRNGWLTVAGYVDAGGVGEALENGARAVWEGLPESEQETARRVFLRLTSTGEGRAATRQRARVDTLVTDRDDLETVLHVLEQFTRQRLLVPDRDEQGRPTVDIAHEALLREWSVLRSWLEEDRATRRLQSRLSAAAKEWDDGGREATGLFAGRRLLAVQEARRTGDITINETELAFLHAAEHRERRERRRSVLLTVLPLVLVAASTILALVLRSQGRLAAEKERTDAVSLAQRAGGLIDHRRDEGALLAVAALNIDRNPTTLGTVIDAVSTADGPLGYPGTVIGRVNALASAFTSDGSAVIGLGDGTIRVVEPVTGEERATFDARLRAVSDVAVAADGTIVAGGIDGDVAVLLGGRSPVRSLPGVGAEVVAVRFDPTSGIVVAATGLGEVYRWQLDGPDFDSLPPISLNGQLLALEVVVPPEGRATGVAALRAGASTFLQPFDLATGELPEPIADGLDSTFGVSLAPFGAQLLVRSSNRVDAWDLTDWTPAPGSDDFARLTAFTAAVARTPGGRAIAFTGSASGELQAWTLDPRPIPVGDERAGFGAAIDAIATDGSTVLVLDDRRRLVAWDVASLRSPAVTPLAPRPDGNLAVAVSPGGTVASGGPSGTITVTGLTGGVSRSLPAPDGAVVGLAWVNDTTLVAATDRGAVREFDLTGQQPRELAAEGPQIVGIGASTDGETVAWATSAGEITIREDGEERTIGPPSQLEDPVVSFALSGDGRAVAIGTAGRKPVAMVLDARSSDEPRLILSGHRLKVTSIAFSPDGDIIATGSDDTTIRLWERSSGDEIDTLEGHTDLVQALAFSGDGKQLVSGGEDFTVRVWDVDDGVSLGNPWRWADSTITSIAVTADGRSLVAANGEFVVRWAFGERGWIDAACRLAGRELTDSEWDELAPNYERIEVCDESLNGDDDQQEGTT
ncbi:WD40 repeat domain-containing protein [Desertimonas flava]|uniref:WD40 repeat domain-containing protein n=1 Tax=Desertimonas flava TaxID=2064846 RepID=UPI0013C4AE67|nr:WD40 repeat domain-containing protein [Desertimonas flava]